MRAAVQKKFFTFRYKRKSAFKLLKKKLSRRSQDDASGVSFKKGNIQTGFQFLNSSADSRLADKKLFGSF